MILRHEDGTPFNPTAPTTGHGLVHACYGDTCLVCAARQVREATA